MDYAGNEVNRLRLMDNAPRWTEPRAATPVTQVRTNAAHYADGRPTARHTYYGALVNEVRNRTMLVSGARFGDGYNLFSVDGFNLASNDWDSARTFPDAPAELGPGNGPAVVDHKASGDIYAFSYYYVLRWSNASNTWTRLHSNTSVYGQYAATAVDTKRNRVFVLGGTGGDRAILDITTNSIVNVTLTGANAASVMGDGNGMVYDPNLDAFLVQKGGAGGTIYRINAQTFAVDTLATQSGASIPSAQNGVWRRFLYVPQLKGVAYIPTYSGNVWFIRTY